ncbi:MAG TPA: hypothetical protein VGL78_10945 [Solirubrobacteraceae bacterium]|jgi:hypothetical protein
MKPGTIEVSPGNWRSEKTLPPDQYRRAHFLLMRKSETLRRCGELLEQIEAKDPGFDGSRYTDVDAASQSVRTFERWERELEAILAKLETR